MKRRSFLQLGAGAAAAACAGALHAAPGESPWWSRAEEPRLVIFIDDTEGLQGPRLEHFRRALMGVGLLPSAIRLEIVEVAGSDDAAVKRTVEACVLRKPAAFVTAASDVATGPGLAAMAGIPLVFATIQNPVSLGLDTEAGPRPWQITGFSYDLSTDGKALELLADAFPGARRVAVMADNVWLRKSAAVAQVEAAARRFGMKIDLVILPVLTEISGALHRLAPDRADACYFPRSDLLMHNSLGLIKLLQASRTPHVFPHEGDVMAGALMSYGASGQAHWHAMARILRLVLSGVPAREIPFERPKDFVLAVNVVQAGRMGIRIPKSILRRANLIV